MDLKIDRKILDSNIAVIKLAGEMDISSANLLKAEIKNLLAEEVLHIVLDLADLEFTDSVGIGAIVAGLTRTNESGGRLCAVAPSRPVKRLMDIVGLFQILDCFDTVQEAEKSLLS